MQEEDCFGQEERAISRYLAKAAQARIPLAVSFELTRRCSFRCVHCYLGDQTSIRRQQHREINTTAAFGLIDEMTASGTMFLTLTGGDPMLRSDFIGIYRHAVHNGLLVTVFCNGSLITDEIINVFVLYPPRAVEVTIYGASRETFEAVTQQPGSFAACMAGIERLRRANVRLRLKTMVLSLNRNDLPILWNMAEVMGVQFRHDCSIIPALPDNDNGSRTNTGRELKDTLRFRLAPEQAAIADLSSAKVKEKLLVQVQDVSNSKSEPSSKLYRCGAGKSSCHITAHGEMKPCIITMQPAFDLAEKQFAESWKEISTFFPEQEANPDFPCMNCGDRKFCTACPANCALETGDAGQAANFYCQYAASRRKKMAECYETAI